MVRIKYACHRSLLRSVNGGVRHPTVTCGENTNSMVADYDRELNFHDIPYGCLCSIPRRQVNVSDWQLSYELSGVTMSLTVAAIMRCNNSQKKFGLQGHLNVAQRGDTNQRGDTMRICNSSQEEAKSIPEIALCLLPS